MQVQVLQVIPGAYGQYGRPTDTDPPRWKSGAPVEYVDVLDGDGGSRRMTLDESVNGGRVDVGTAADLVCEVAQTQDVVYDRSGKERIRSRDKWRVVGMQAAPASKS
jgi:hypothetical protein